MNGRIMLPNNPLFFLQFIIFPAILAFIANKVGITVKSTVELLGTTKIVLIIFLYFLLIIGIVLNSLIIIESDNFANENFDERIKFLEVRKYGKTYFRFYAVS